MTMSGMPCSAIAVFSGDGMGQTPIRAKRGKARNNLPGLTWINRTLSDRLSASPSDCTSMPLVPSLMTHIDGDDVAVVMTETLLSAWFMDTI
jgi:hypothetical protein